MSEQPFIMSPVERVDEAAKVLEDGCLGHHWPETNEDCVER